MFRTNNSVCLDTVAPRIDKSKFPNSFTFVKTKTPR